MDQNQENNNVVSDSSKSRRQFIQKASAASLIVAIPAKTSWASGGSTGCSVSGNLSGNLSNGLNSCNSTTVSSSGFSPGKWKNHFNPNHNQFGKVGANVPKQPPKWKEIFGNFRPPRNGSGGKNWTRINEWLPQGEFNREAINKHLLTAYLNSAAGLYSFVQPSDAKSYIQGLYDSLDDLNNSVTDQQMIQAIKATYS